MSRDIQNVLNSQGISKLFCKLSPFKKVAISEFLTLENFLDSFKLAAFQEWFSIDPALLLRPHFRSFSHQRDANFNNNSSWSRSGFGIVSERNSSVCITVLYIQHKGKDIRAEKCEFITFLFKFAQTRWVQTLELHTGNPRTQSQDS